jgi:hypothetical protein
LCAEACKLSANVHWFIFAFVSAACPTRGSEQAFDIHLGLIFDLAAMPLAGQLGNFYTVEPFYTAPAARGRKSAFAPRAPAQIQILRLQR